METATQNLVNDHVQIIRLIEVMDKIVLQENPNISDIEEVIYLIKNFADVFHHSKEENMLFPLLGKKGFSAQQGPVAVMLAEHSEGREFVKGMEISVNLLKNGNKDSIKNVYENMRGYGMLLRNHIAKENNILFPMADRNMSEEENKALLERFVEFEGKSYCGSLMGNCLNRLNTLIVKYQ